MTGKGRGATKHLDGWDTARRQVFRVSNGRVEQRAIRDFFDSDLQVGDVMTLYRPTREQKITVYPGDIIVRKEGEHVLAD